MTEVNNELFETIIYDIENSKNEEMNILKMIYDISFKKKFTNEQKNKLSEALTIYLIDNFNIKNEIMVNMLINLTLYNQLESFEVFGKYCSILYKMMLEEKFNMAAKYKWFTIKSLMNVLELDFYEDMKVEIHRLESYAQLDFLDILSEYLAMRRLIEFNDIESDKYMASINNNFDLAISGVDLDLFVDEYIDSSDEEKFRYIFEYLLSQKKKIGYGLLKRGADIYSRKPYLLNSIGDFCEYSEMVDILILLIIREYKGQFVSISSVKKSVEFYIEEVFKNNLIVEECNLLDLSVLTEVMKIATMNLICDE